MMKGQKGITLVALIITIIVMLILVGVSITVAVNGGLFEKADTAAQETNKAKMSEAVALAKAEILTDFYSAETNAERLKKSTDTVAGLIEDYLGDENITFEVTEDDEVNGYNVEITNPDYIDDITIDLTGVEFATEGE